MNRQFRKIFQRIVPPTGGGSGLCPAVFVWAASLLLASNVLAVTNNVASIAALQTAIDGAASGDVIVLANGTYLNSTINLGTSDIIVRAGTPGGVFLNGTTAISISGDRVTFSGFQFTSGTITGIPIQVTGSQNLLTQLNFDGYSAQKYINVQAPSQSNVIAYCNFRNKPASAPQGNLVHFGADETVVGYHKIRYCSFRDMPGAGGDNGNECIRLSNGAQSNYVARTVVEYCYFNNTGDGDSEAISVKCRENVIRYCTFTNNQNAMLVFRNGNDNIAYGNFFIGAGGIRVKEANNIYCYNNYFENSGVGGTMNAVTYVYISPNLNNINFLHNTFVECGLIDFDTGATANTWANNIFKKSSGNIFAGSATGITWAGNIRSGNLGITISSGMTNTNPQLVLNSNGCYGLASNSPAIDASSASYPAIPDITNVDDDPSLLLDISGQARPASKILKDVGCDEFGTNNTLNRPLALADVGPSYLGGPGEPISPTIVTQPQSQTVNAGAPVSFFVAVTGTAPLSYQWRKDGTNLVGAITATNSIAAAQATNAGSYTVVVTNMTGSITSAVATLTVNIPPAIGTDPQSQSVNEGAPVSFFVVATGTAPLSYQWRKTGTNIAGATGATNSIAAAQTTNAGDYTVVVTNVAGSITSAVATLTVTGNSSNNIVTSTNVWLDDLWVDGTRTNSSLPVDSAWYAATTGSSLTAVTNAMIGIPSSSGSLTWWTYFTTNPASPVQLDVSDTLRVTLTFRAYGVNANNSARGLRVGLHNSTGCTRIIGDGTNPNGTNVTGLLLNLNFGQTFGGSAPTMQLLERTNLASNNLLSTTGDYSPLSSAAGPAVGSPGFSNGVPYTLQLLVHRNSNSADVTATFSNTNGWSASVTASWTNLNYLTSAFDTFAFRPTQQTQTATNFTFTEFKVELVSTKNQPPVIGTEPQSQIVNQGAPVSFFVAATGTAPLSYQWRKDGTNIAGATAATNTIAAAQTTNAGNYTVVVTSVAGSVTSAVATLTVNVPPAIGDDPRSQIVNAGSPVSFWVTATGTAPMTYQWRKDGTNIAGSTDATNTLVAAQSGNAGSYAVVVTNVAGSITSAVATLTVVITQPQINSIVPGVGGSFALSGTGPVGEGYRILATTNLESPLANWPVVDTGVFTGGVFNFTDNQATNHLQRFYRVATP